MLVFLDPGRDSGLEEKPKKWHKDIKVMEGRRHGLGRWESPNIFWCSEEKGMTLKGVEMASTQHSSDWGQGFCRVGLGQRDTLLCNRAGMSDGVHPNHELVVGCRTRARQKKSPAA